MRTGRLVIVLLTTLALLVAAGCNSTLNLRANETLVKAKARNLDGLKIHIAEVVDNRSLTDRIGAHENATNQEIWVYAAEPAVKKQVHTALSQGFKAAGGQLVSDPKEADFQVMATVVEFRVTTHDYMVTASTDGVVALDVTYLDGKGYELEKRSFNTPFERDGSDAEAITGHFRQQVAEAVAEGDVVAGNAQIVANTNTGGGGEDSVGPGDDGTLSGGEDIALAPDAGEPAETRRIFLRFAAPKRQLETFESKGVYFQGLVLEAGGIEFAGTAEMDEVYSSLCSDMGVAADEERQCRLQAARRLFVDDVIHLEVQKADKQWEVTMQVWNPESNGMIAAKAVKLDASSVGAAAEQALPTLACSYLKHRGVQTPTCKAK